MDSRTREALEAKAFDTIIRCRPARVIMYEDAIALLTAEPEQCEDARNVAAQVSAVFGVSRSQIGGDPGNDPALDRATEVIAAFASQVADKRAEELRVENDRFDFKRHLQHQREWSEKTFGPGERTLGLIDHIAKELLEIADNPNDLSEWIDVVILALDGAWRIGHSPDEIIAALAAKQEKNERRKWPDWRTAEPGKAIEHIEDEALAATEPKP